MCIRDSNNVVYYSWFDTAVNAYLIEQGVLDIHQGQTIGLVIETQCNYFSPLAFPQAVEAGIRVARLGNSSVRYEVGLFAQGEPLTAAKGHFIHVYVDRHTPVSYTHLDVYKRQRQRVGPTSCQPTPC